MPANGNSPARACSVAVSEISCAGDYFTSLAQVLKQVPHSIVDEIAEILLRSYDERRKVFIFGNGGSAALASHFACDLGKGTTARLQRAKRFRAIALTDNIPMMTAWANDSSYDDIFVEQLRNMIEPGDIAFAISASGNSPNVLRALEAAHRIGGYCVGLTGFAGGKMKRLCDVSLVVPSDNMQLIEDAHLGVAHALFTIIRSRLENGRFPAVTNLVTAEP